MRVMAKTEALKIEDNGQFYGVVGKNNTIVVPFEYDEISSPNDAYAAAIKF